MKTMKKQIIYISCWKCGKSMAVAEIDYRNGLICESCWP